MGGRAELPRGDTTSTSRNSRRTTGCGGHASTEVFRRCSVALKYARMSGAAVGRDPMAVRGQTQTPKSSARTLERWAAHEQPLRRSAT